MGKGQREKERAVANEVGLGGAVGGRMSNGLELKWGRGGKRKARQMR